MPLWLTKGFIEMLYFQRAGKTSKSQMLLKMGLWNVKLILEFPSITHVLYGTEKIKKPFKSASPDCCLSAHPVKDVIISST